MRYQVGMHACWLNNSVSVENDDKGQLFIVKAYDGRQFTRLSPKEAFGLYEALCEEVLNKQAGNQ